MTAAMTLRDKTSAERDTDTATAVILSPLPRLPDGAALYSGVTDVGLVVPEIV